MNKNRKFNFRFQVVFLILLITNSCKMNHKFNTYQIYDFAISTIWKSSNCLTSEKKELLDIMLDSPLEGIDTITIKKWLGGPIHKRFFSDDSFVFVYFYAGSPSSLECPYSDLLCIEFDNKNEVAKTFIFSILEDVNATNFWHSNSLPRISIQDESLYLDHFYK